MARFKAEKYTVESATDPFMVFCLGMEGYRVTTVSKYDPLRGFVRRNYTDYRDLSEAQADADTMSALSAHDLTEHLREYGMAHEKAAAGASWTIPELTAEEEEHRAQLYNEFCDNGMSEEQAWDKAGDRIMEEKRL